MARGKAVFVVFVLILVAMSQMIGCGEDKGTTPEGDTVSSRIQEDIDRGKAFLDLKEYDKAVDAFVEALGKEPDSDVAHYYLALTYLRWGKEEQAISEYKKLLTLNSPKADDEELVVWIHRFLGLDLYETKHLTVNEVDGGNPSFSWDGGQIVFISERDGNWEIYVMESDGSDQRRLTVNEADDYSPSFSPDGTQIVFMSLRDGRPNIYVMASDGSNQRRLTVNRAYNYSPSFSPDGGQIMFESNQDGNDEIYVMASDGLDQSRLTVNEADDKFPSFSPDGTQIVFMSLRDGMGTTRFT